MTDTLTDLLIFCNTWKTESRWLHTTAKSTICVYRYNLYYVFPGITKSLKIIKLPKFLYIRVAHFSGPDPSSSCRCVLQKGTLVPGLLRCFGAGAELAQNCCRWSTTSKAGTGFLAWGHPQWQGRHGWGCPGWSLSALNGCGYSWAGLFTSGVLEKIQCVLPGLAEHTAPPLTWILLSSCYVYDVL